ncbi:MAG: hypothetical protein PHH77_12995 [Victivallaceae bacterium]|nr:hypothetical protein [Victivallaceae bacterium]
MNGIEMRCGKCGGLTPLEKAFLDADGVIVKCKHCGQYVDREKLRFQEYWPEKIKTRQLKLKI